MPIKQKNTKESPLNIEAIDLFCGAGGLSYGLITAGISVRAGIDMDPACAFPYSENNRAIFLKKDIQKVNAAILSGLYSTGAIRLLAGCAPCQPFSTLARGRDTSEDAKWGLLQSFTKLVRDLKPELVTMENVPRVMLHKPYQDFLKALKELGYHVSAKPIKCSDYGIPQVRRRFVLIASKLGPIEIPEPLEKTTTVREAIGHLPPVMAGKKFSKDPLHRAPTLGPMNLKRIQHSRPGGTWKEWPKKLRSPCHQEESGASFKAVYGRMEWDSPSPTITTQSFNYGTGRFGHPTQNRAITLREAAILQSFSPDYKFAASEKDIKFGTIGRLIGNAVPPKLGEIIGNTFVQHLRDIGYVRKPSTHDRPKRP